MGELAAERRAVSRAISALRLTPVMFEAGARPYPPRDLYRAYLAQSDVFIGLYWQRYGEAAPGTAVSGLEEEFELSSGLPRRRAGLGAWPMLRPAEAALVGQIRQALSTDRFEQAYEAGIRLSQREAVAAARGTGDTESARPR
jgi:Domain of unknown function (DUF4062)